MSAGAVSRAIKSGRLVRAVVRDTRGRSVGILPAIADEEWERATQHNRRHATADAPAPAAPSSVVSTPAIAYREEQTRLTGLRADREQMELDELRGRLIDAGDVDERLTAVFTRCRTKLLGVPGKVKASLPHLSHADIATVDALIRAALEDLGTPGSEGATWKH